MRVLYIAAECKPFSKAGGVGDVAGELPIALKNLGVDIEIVVPGYGDTAETAYTVQYHRPEAVGLKQAETKGVPVTLVTNQTYFATDYSASPRPAPPFSSAELFRGNYARPYVDSVRIPYYDDAARFSFFSEACLELIARKKPDIVHINDWMLGYLFGRMKMLNLPQKRVLTVHNMSYQGNLWRGDIARWPMEAIADDKRVGKLFADPHADWDNVNAMRLGLELADQTNTVSPTYMKEIAKRENPAKFFEGGKGLERVCAKLAKTGRLHGILNAFDYQFAPTDETFEAVMHDKAAMKAQLSSGFQNPAGMLLGFVGRAVEQKFRLLAEPLDGRSVLDHILAIDGVNVAIVATGLPKYEDFLRSFSGRPNFAAIVAFDREKARQISLGSDVFLMPSVFEPCGITQMESMNWATPPLVRWTGGLVDTVVPHTRPDGTGFGFDGATPAKILQNLVKSVRDAKAMFEQAPARFRELQRRGFQQRFLWSASAKQYEEMYGIG
jgi:starch synthase